MVRRLIVLVALLVVTDAMATDWRVFERYAWAGALSLSGTELPSMIAKPQVSYAPPRYERDAPGIFARVCGQTDIIWVRGPRIYTVAAKPVITLFVDPAETALIYDVLLHEFLHVIAWSENRADGNAWSDEGRVRALVPTACPDW